MCIFAGDSLRELSGTIQYRSPITIDTHIMTINAATQAAALLLLLGAPASSSATTTIVLNGSALGPRFEGWGGLSGGGATSRLLPDYDPAIAADILDLLFKPFYGASLHSLKVEVGGDTFSGCGVEPSHMHNATDFNVERGYEWWLMREATARNPSLLGYALPWGMPNWIGANTSGSPLNAQLALYMAKFCVGALSVGGTWSCDYCGVWNERAYSTSFVLELRAALDAAGLASTKIVVHDGGWDAVPDVLSNSSFAAAVDVIGVHYPSGSNSTASAIRTGKPLWSSEDSSTFFDAAGGQCLSRVTNWNYVYGNFVSLYIWNLVTAYAYPLFWYGDSLMAAATPWSGAYSIESPLWAAAHTTQFAWPGWRYLPSTTGIVPAASGGSGLLPGGGTFVTLVDTTGTTERVEERVATAMAGATCTGADFDAADCTHERTGGSAVELRRRFHEEELASGRAYGSGTPRRNNNINNSGEQQQPSARLHWSLVIETSTSAHSQCIRSNPAKGWTVADEQNVTFVLGDGLAVPTTVVVWKSVFWTSAHEPAIVWFERQTDLVVDAASGTFTLTGIHPDSTYSLTSLDRGQRHGTPAAPPPPDAPFPSHYADSFADLPLEHMAAFFSDQVGSFAAQPRRDGGAGTAYEQGE